MKKIKILLVDDHVIVRQGIRSYINLEPERYEVVGEANDGVDALNELTSKIPDIILMDINMPQKDGIKTTKEVKKKYPDIKILALSMLSESQHIKAMIRSGADGYLLKNVSPEELFKAIDQIIAGKTYFSFEVSQEALSSFNKNCFRQSSPP